MSNFTVGNSGQLKDTQGTTIGQVDYHGQVRDGLKDRGRVDDQGRYTDEYGRDRGWTVRSSGGDGGGGAGAAAGILILGLLTLGIFSLVQYIRDEIRKSQTGSYPIPQGSNQIISGYANAGLALGIAGWCFPPILFLGIMYGQRAKVEIRNSQGRLAGEGKATAAIVLGWIGVISYGALLIGALIVNSQL